MSYEDMPFYLKPCFLHLASFPEDYEIDVSRLIRMWAAERIIPPNDKKTMEETAEDLLQQLFQRNMVQLSLSRYVYLGTCRVHDLLRELAMHEAKKINFVTIFGNPQDVNHSHRVTRRATIQSDGDEFIKHIGPKTRSLLLFSNYRMIDHCRIINSLNFPEFRLLRVLEIEGVRNMELRGLDQLIHLKYMAIKNCQNFKLHIENSLGRLKNLETFDLRETTLSGDFDQVGLWTIGTLRHVRTSALYDSWELPFNANLRNLQTLETVKVSKEWHKDDQLPCLNSLRTLSLDIKETSDAIVLLLGTLPFLLSLEIFSNLIPKEIVYPTALPKYQNLQSLHLIGRWHKSVSLEVSLFPQHLVELTLHQSFLGQDPMPELGKLQSLKTLKLVGYALGNGRHMICPAGFPALQTIDVSGLLDVDLLRVEKGVMPKLKYIRKPGKYQRARVKVEMPPELQHLIADN
ncbi:hypothetical protein LUZ63_004060 [Rhynchospora breviuscula]|uniref:Uncharacterized protein n=1 Tax=Rhynchospora breviuscula TaxID=2022672 RepID=A0A9Q0D1S2_9POAL|nr:hypothetical protein LUZ63_004060 [Rhynchospora breviuscula]